MPAAGSTRPWDESWRSTLDEAMKQFGAAFLGHALRLRDGRSVTDVPTELASKVLHSGLREGEQAKVLRNTPTHSQPTESPDSPAHQNTRRDLRAMCRWRHLLCSTCQIPKRFKRCGMACSRPRISRKFEKLSVRHCGPTLDTMPRYALSLLACRV